MSRRILSVAAAAATAAALALSTQALAAPKHGISVFGELKYPPGFTHFDYVNPKAPKGGRIRIPGLDTFESVNPFILKGRKEVLAGSLLFDTLMTRATDEPDALYALVAKGVEVEPDRSGVTFILDERAKFHDGSRITSADVVFTFNTLMKKGHPQYRFLYGGVQRVVAETEQIVHFEFKDGEHRDLPTNLAGLPVLSKAYYEKNEFDKTTFEAPLASGPYKIEKLEPGRSVTYRRVEDYWARDLPVNLGRWNFDRIVVEYFRDREIAFQALFADAYDFREEFTSRQWATQYNEAPVRNKLVVRETLNDDTPSGVQAFIPNLRRDKFKDRRVRQAIDLAFDFEWTNRTLFYGLYDRTNSMFENSSLAAKAPPTPAELKLLEPLRGKIPDEVFTKPYLSPKTDGTGRVRGNLRKAARLLKQAGYQVKDGALLDKAGKPFEIEFLLFERSFERIINPYIKNLRRLGISARIRVVDVANFKVRTDSHDFDIVIRRFAQPLTPGVEQQNYFGSDSASVKGAFNIGGIQDPAVDALIERLMSAKSRDQVVTAARALDRVLMWNNYVIPQWYKGSHNVAYWNRFDRPKVKPKFARGVIDTWWYNPKKSEMVERGNAPPLPPNYVSIDGK